MQPSDCFQGQRYPHHSRFLTPFRVCILSNIYTHVSQSISISERTASLGLNPVLFPFQYSCSTTSFYLSLSLKCTAVVVWFNWWHCQIWCRSVRGYTVGVSWSGTIGWVQLVVLSDLRLQRSWLHLRCDWVLESVRRVLRSCCIKLHVRRFDWMALTSYSYLDFHRAWIFLREDCSTSVVVLHISKKRREDHLPQKKEQRREKTKRADLKQQVHWWVVGFLPDSQSYLILQFTDLKDGFKAQDSLR